MSRINGVCECGAEYWVEPNPYTIRGFCDRTYYMCKECGAELYQCREDAMIGRCSANVRLE